MNKSTKSLLLTHSLRMILENFISTFLGAYFLSVTNGNVLTVTKYYMVVYSLHIIFFYLIYRFCSKIKDVHIYRASLIVKLVECLLLLLLGDNVANHVYLIALMQGLSQSLYYTVYKTIITDIANNSYGKYFAFARAGECTIGFICGIVFAEMIDNKNLGFSAVFVVLIISSIFALISSLFIKVKSKKKRQPHFRLVKFMKHTYNRHALYRVWAATICYGLTEGGLLAVLVNLVISINTSGNKTIGYLSSAVSLFAILYSFMHKRYINESNFKERLLPASIISFIIAIPLAFTGNILAIVAFRFISAALTGSILIERNRTTYDLITTITSPRYRKEYFYINEVMLDISRIVSMAMIFIVMHYTNDASNLTYLFIIGTIGYFIAILLLNGLYKYYYVGPCEEAKNEMKKDETE